MRSFIFSWLKVFLVWRWPDYYRAHIIKITTSGYIPEPSQRMWHVVRGILRFWRFVQVGKVKVVGAQHLQAPGRVIFCPNHGSLLDAQVFLPVLRRHCRGLGAYEPMRRAAGLPALLLTSLGVLAVDRSRGYTVMEPAIKLLVDGHPLVIFPEAKVSPTGELLPLKQGPGRIVKETYERLGGKERVGVVTVYIHYNKRHVASATNYGRMGFRWRGGATVTVTPPIWYNDLPVKSSENMTQALLDEMIRLREVAPAINRRSR